MKKYFILILSSSLVFGCSDKSEPSISISEEAAVTSYTSTNPTVAEVLAYDAKADFFVE